MAKFVYFFGEGKAEGSDSQDMIELLGNKGAQLSLEKEHGWMLKEYADRFKAVKP